MPFKFSPAAGFSAVLVLFFLSGAIGLVFQALWMRELALLLGSGARAAAAALAAFFLGLALGSAFWGRRCAGLARPLRLYGWLELAVATAALGLFAMLPVFHGLYGLLYERLLLALQPGSAAVLLTTLKLGLALLLLFPAAFFMGGTLPVLSQHLVSSSAASGARLPLLYGINTAGGAAGAFVAAFVLPSWLGWRWTYWLAVAAIAAVGLTVLWLDGRRRMVPTAATASDGLSLPTSNRRSAASTTPADLCLGPNGEALSGPMLTGLALLSGFCALGLEVLWTRMLAQVLQNSVYSFAAILICFLLALSIGAVLAGRLTLPTGSGTSGAAAVIGLLLTLSGLAVGASPLVFDWLTDDLDYLEADADWAGYVLMLFGATALVVLPPTLLLGTLFPYLLRVAAGGRATVGAVVGHLAALNTLGAIAGSIAAGFVLLDWLGLWRSIQLMAGLYLSAALLLAMEPQRAAGRPARAAVLLPIAGWLALITVLDASRLPVVRVDPIGRNESLYQAWESGAGVVAVVRRGAALGIKVDNHYTLGSTAGLGFEERQAHFPLLLHPQPQRVFFIGLGTGVTAGAALRHPVQQVVAAELLPDAITAARTYFRPWQNGLFEDPRTRIIAADGRHHLAATSARFDVVVGDLFVPWKAGTGGLYTIEHFRTVRERLRPGGLFAQWLPLYQLTEREFGILTRTFLQVFPDVQLWRGDFLPRGPIVALVGRAAAEPLDPQALMERAAALITDQGNRGLSELLPDKAPPLLLYYAGNPGQARHLFSQWPLNTDAHPRIELGAPRSQRQVRAGETQWLIGERLIALFDRLLAAAPPATDPYLSRLSTAQQGIVGLGLRLFRERAGADPGAETSGPTSTEALVTPSPAPELSPDSVSVSGETQTAPDIDALRTQLRMLREQRDALDRRLDALED